MLIKKNWQIKVLATAAIIVNSTLSYAADWSTTEVQLQHGNLSKPFQGGGNEAETSGSTIVTFQHASGWQYGDNFFFFDYINYGKTDFEKSANLNSDSEIYGEWYSNFSLSKMTGDDFSFGFVKDVGLLAGFNFAAEVDTFYYLPGVRLSLALPGFAFANLDITAFIQNAPSNAGNGVSIDEDNAYMIDFNWAYPFKIGSSSWSIEGHVEYIDSADTTVSLPNNITVDGKRESWILAQPQLRLDLGESLGMTPQQLFVGIEYQYWKNKLGDKDTDESVVQALLVWRL
mgnify:CR=1 FL=1